MSHPKDTESGQFRQSGLRWYRHVRHRDDDYVGRKVLELEDAVVVEKKAGKTRCSQQCHLLNSLNYSVPELLEQSIVAISSGDLWWRSLVAISGGDL